MKIEDSIRNLIEKDINNIGIILDEVKYVKEGSIYFLRIIIDKETYIVVDDCLAVTKLINPILDEQNIIKESYILDVCSKEKEGI